MNDRERHFFGADREMHERSLGLRAPIMLGGHLDRPKAVRFGTRFSAIIHVDRSSFSDGRHSWEPAKLGACDRLRTAYSPSPRIRRWPGATTSIACQPPSCPKSIPEVIASISAKRILARLTRLFMVPIAQPQTPAASS